MDEIDRFHLWWGLELTDGVRDIIISKLKWHECQSLEEEELRRCFVACVQPNNMRCIAQMMIEEGSLTMEKLR